LIIFVKELLGRSK